MSRIRWSNVHSAIHNYWFLFLVLIVIPLLYCPGFIDPVLLPKFWGLALGTMILGVTLLIGSKHQHLNLSFLRHPMVYAIIVYLIIAGLSLAWTINVADGYFEWSKTFLVFALLVFLPLHFQRIPIDYSRIAQFVVVLTLLTSLVAYYQFFLMVGTVEVSHNATYLLKSTFAHRNLFAQVILLMLPFNLFGLISLKKIWRGLAVIAILISLVIIIFSLSRAVWVGLLVSAIIAGIGYLLIRRPWKLPATEKKKTTNKIIAASGLLILTFSGTIYLYSSMDTFQTFEKQVQESVNFSYGSVKERFELWERSLNMFKNKPVTGTGLGSWNIEMLKYGPSGLQSQDEVTFFQRPHNDWLWVLSENGIIGAVSYFGIFLLGIFGYYKLIRKEKNQERQVFFLLMITALFSYMVIAIFSFPKERITHQILLAFMLLPVLLEQTKSVKKTSKRLGKSAIGFMTCLCIVVFISISFRAFGELQLKKAYQARNNKQWRLVIQQVEKASNPFYRIDPMSTPVTWYSGLAYFNIGEIDSALALFKEAYKYNPWHLHVLNNMGTCYEIKNDHESAKQFYKKAIEVAPSFDDAHINLCAVYFNNGEYEKAYKQISKCDSTHQKYENYLLAVVKKKAQPLVGRVEETHLRDKLKHILNTDEWLISIHRKSMKHDRNFDHQMILDAIYALNVRENVITLDQAKALKNKYKSL